MLVRKNRNNSYVRSFLLNGRDATCIDAMWKSWSSLIAHVRNGFEYNSHKNKKILENSDNNRLQIAFSHTKKTNLVKYTISRSNAHPAEQFSQCQWQFLYAKHSLRPLRNALRRSFFLIIPIWILTPIMPLPWSTVYCFWYLNLRRDCLVNLLIGLSIILCFHCHFLFPYDFCHERFSHLRGARTYQAASKGQTRCKCEWLQLQLQTHHYIVNNRSTMYGWHVPNHHTANNPLKLEELPPSGFYHMLCPITP